MDDPDDIPEIPDRYQVHIWMKNRETNWLYQVQHWFTELPPTELLTMLLDEAKGTFAALYPGVEADDFSVLVDRLRPADNFRPDFSRLL